MTTKKAWQQNLDHAQKPLFKPNRSTLIGKTESCQNKQHSKFASLGPLYDCLTLWFKINTFSQSNQFPSYIQEIPGPTIYHIVEQTVRSSFPFSKDLLVFWFTWQRGQFASNGNSRFFAPTLLTITENKIIFFLFCFHKDIINGI